MATKKAVAEIQQIFDKDEPARFVANEWDKLNNQRQGKMNEWSELSRYIFATDTSTTTNASLPWKNSTTLPKLCQIRDNLHSNYLSALFPNDDWVRWIGYSREDSVRKKVDAIQGYISNKCRQNQFHTEMSKLLYDFIDYGNAFATVSYESDTKTDQNGRVVPIYNGPKIHRISPYDIVFNPLARSFEETYKIVRSVRTEGELMKLAQTDPSQEFWNDVLERRQKMKSAMGAVSREEFEKAVQYSVDGFGSLYEYYSSDYVEILEFYGDFHDKESGELKTDQVITVVDRSYTADQRDSESWFGNAPIFHVGWRFRQDNLWAMGPLDNLVGMQYRIDHLENLKADAMDLAVHPPLGITGDVEAFRWEPGAQIEIGENGSVGEIAKNLNGVIAAANEIQQLQDMMELYAGAPREAMGVRTPGEKTAFEVQQLQNAAGRIFQEKITNFEIELLEPVLNAMLETSRRNMDATDVIRTMDSSTGVDTFLEVTQDDIVARGKIRPVGARHFAKQAQDLQNLIGVMNSPVGQMIAPHTSGKELVKFVADMTNLNGYDIFRPYAALEEQQEMQQQQQQMQEDMQVQQTQPMPRGM